MKEPGSAEHETTPANEADRLGQQLRTLRPIEEKVVRLAYGIGCERAHGAEEIAMEFGVAPALIVEILEEAERRLEQAGVVRNALERASGPVFTHRCRPRG